MKITLELVKHLQALGKGETKPGIEAVGICSELLDIFWISGNDLKPNFEQWPKYSGSASFPVPHPEFEAGYAYGSDNLWEDDEYGDNRRELCLFLADQFEIELNINN